VIVLERANVRTLDFDSVPEPADVAVIDVSFISLTLVLPRIRELMREPYGKPIVALVKPQFEVGRDQVGKGGVVRDEAARRGAVDKVRAWAIANGFTAHEDVESPITGPAGNVEYLLLLRTAERTASALPERVESPRSAEPDEPGASNDSSESSSESSESSSESSESSSESPSES
jgi:23S rRNA (cytidine1920-2'-O)/16S rRNA (cytidine1409-2'-O)-methyltransferase